MRSLVIAAGVVLLVGSMFAVARHRPDPKHLFLFSLVERLPADSAGDGHLTTDTLELARR